MKSRYIIADMQNVALNLADYSCEKGTLDNFRLYFGRKVGNKEASLTINPSDLVTLTKAKSFITTQVDIPIIQQHQPVKEFLDNHILCDTMELAHSLKERYKKKESLPQIIIVSKDMGFIFLTMKLQSMGFEVILAPEWNLKSHSKEIQNSDEEVKTSLPSKDVIDFIVANRQELKVVKNELNLNAITFPEDLLDLKKRLLIALKENSIITPKDRNKVYTPDEVENFYRSLDSINFYNKKALIYLYWSVKGFRIEFPAN